MNRWTLGIVTAVASGVVFAQRQQHLNPMIDLLAQHKPVLGIYAPRAGGGRRRARWGAGDRCACAEDAGATRAGRAWIQKC